MLFSNLLVAIGLTVLFPLGLMGLLAAGEWLERRTLAGPGPRPRRGARGSARPAGPAPAAGTCAARPRAAPAVTSAAASTAYRPLTVRRAVAPNPPDPVIVGGCNRV